MRDVKFGKDQTRGAPKSVMLWGTFHVNAEATQTAVGWQDEGERTFPEDEFRCYSCLQGHLQPAW